jgi:anti-sigma factor RsiW
MTPHHFDRDTIVDYLHGAVPPALDAALLVHLERCADCRAVVDDEAALGEAIRAAARAGEREFPSMVRARVWDAVRRERPSLLDRLRSRWAPAFALPVAAALLLAAFVGTPVLRSATAPGVAASFYLDEHNAEETDNPLGPTVTPAVYTTDGTPATSAASYIDTADAATLDAAGAAR